MEVISGYSEICIKRSVCRGNKVIWDGMEC